MNEILSNGKKEKMIDTQQNMMSFETSTVKLNWLEYSNFISAVLNKNIVANMENNTVWITILGKKVTDKQFINLIANNYFLLVHLDLKETDQFSQIPANVLIDRLRETRALAETFPNTSIYREQNNLVMQLLLILIHDNINSFTNAVLANKHFKRLLENHCFLTNMLCIYNFFDTVTDKLPQALQLLLPLILQKCYQHFNKLDIETIILLNSITSKTEYQQHISLFATTALIMQRVQYSIKYSDISLFMLNTDRSSPIPAKTLDLYFYEDQINEKRALNFTCYSIQDFKRTIKKLKFYLWFSDLHHKNRNHIFNILNHLTPNIHLNGYRKVISSYEKLTWNNDVKEICRILLTAPD